MNSKSIFFIIALLRKEKGRVWLHSSQTKNQKPIPAHSQVSFLIMKNAVSDDDMLIVVYSPFAPNRNAFPISYP